MDDSDYAIMVQMAGIINAAAEQLRADGKTLFEGQDKVWLGMVAEMLREEAGMTDSDLRNVLPELRRLGLVHLARADMGHIARHREYRDWRLGEPPNHRDVIRRP